MPTLSTHNPGSDFGCLPTFEELTNRLTIVQVNLWHHATAVPDNQTLYNRNHALCSSLAITVDRLTIYQGTNKGLGLGLPSESYLCNVNISSALKTTAQPSITGQERRTNNQENTVKDEPRKQSQNPIKGSNHHGRINKLLRSHDILAL